MSTEKSDLKYDCTASSPFKYHLNTEHENQFDHLFARSFRFARLIQCLMSLGYFLDLIWWLLYSRVCQKRRVSYLESLSLVFLLYYSRNLLTKASQHHHYHHHHRHHFRFPGTRLIKKKDTINKK